MDDAWRDGMEVKQVNQYWLYICMFESVVERMYKLFI